MNICELIHVGTELLLGEILNSNAQFLCRELAALGIAVQRIQTVGDNPARLKEDFLSALARSHIVILTGGLGPTKDDLTKETVCEALGIPLVEDPAQRKAIAEFFQRRGGAFGESNFKQALAPKGCTVLYNANGTAPGCAIDFDYIADGQMETVKTAGFTAQGLEETAKGLEETAKGLEETAKKLVVCLPGPPKELQPMFRQSLRPLLAPYGGGAIVSHHVNTIGLGESRMAELTSAWHDNENPTVAPYAKDGESYLRVSAFAATRTQAEALCAPVLESLKKILGNYVYSIDKSLEETLLQLLREQGKTIAFAESCTGGGIAARLTDLPGASEVFGYGYVTYANRAKQELLGVQAQTIARHGAVSEACAREMANGARSRSGASVAVAVTGVAGPGQSETKPAGLVFLAATDGRQTLVKRLDTGRSDRAYNRIAAVKAALALARELLVGTI
jgi:nicotinamide-nucleotide amidase